MLTLTIFLVLGAVAAAYLGYRHINENPETIITAVQEEANIAMNNIQQTAVRNGVREWSLDAKSGRLIEDRKQAILKHLSVTFFLKDGREIRLRAAKGIVSTDTNNMEVEGNVVVENGTMWLKTEQLHYDHGRRLFTSRAPVRISDKTFNIVADAMVFDLNTKQAEFEGHVKGLFSESIQL